MKKHAVFVALQILLALVLVLALAGCGKKASDSGVLKQTIQSNTVETTVAP